MNRLIGLSAKLRCSCIAVCLLLGLPHAMAQIADIGGGGPPVETESPAEPERGPSAPSSTPAPSPRVDEMPAAVSPDKINVSDESGRMHLAPPVKPRDPAAVALDAFDDMQEPIIVRGLIVNDCPELALILELAAKEQELLSSTTIPGVELQLTQSRLDYLIRKCFDAGQTKEPRPVPHPNPPKRNNAMSEAPTVWTDEEAAVYTTRYDNAQHRLTPPNQQPNFDQIRQEYSDPKGRDHVADEWSPDNAVPDDVEIRTPDPKKGGTLIPMGTGKPIPLPKDLQEGPTVMTPKEEAALKNKPDWEPTGEYKETLPCWKEIEMLELTIEQLKKEMAEDKEPDYGVSTDDADMMPVFYDEIGELTDRLNALVKKCAEEEGLR